MNKVRFHETHSLTPFSSFKTPVPGIRLQIFGNPRKWSKFSSPTSRYPNGRRKRIRILRRSQPSQTRISTVDLCPCSGSSRDDQMKRPESWVSDWVLNVIVVSDLTKEVSGMLFSVFDASFLEWKYRVDEWSSGEDRTRSLTAIILVKLNLEGNRVSMI